MILGIPTRPGLRVMVASTPVDFRRGMDGLAALVSQTLAAGTGWFDHAEHHAVTAFVFRHGLDADTSTHKHAGTPGYTARKIAERTVIF